MMDTSITDIISAQRRFFESRQTQDLAYRKEKLQNLKVALYKNKEDIYEALKKDFGRHPFDIFITEIGFCIDEINLILEQLDDWVKPEVVASPEHLAYSESTIYRQAKGVCLIIGAFNLPFHLSLMPMITAIAAGNTALVKPSELTKSSESLIKNLLKELFEPEHVSCVTGGADTTQALLEQKFDHIFFTGSQKIGKILLEKAASHLTPVTLELGGKSPCIVHEDADLEYCARRIIYGKFLNAGQICNAPDYLLVHDTVKSQLIDKLCQVLIEFYGEDAAQSEDYGRIVNTRHFERLVAMINADATQNIVVGGNSDTQQRYIAPTIIDNVSLTHPCMQEEIFGPILPILSYSHWDEVRDITQKIGDSPLAAYLFTDPHPANNAELKQQFISQLRYGGGCINDVVVQISNPNLPFGGSGNSGLGAYHGRWGFEEFSHRKAMVSANTLELGAFTDPPYGNKIDIIHGEG